MLEFIAGLGAGTIAFAALSFALASRKDRKAREQMQRHVRRLLRGDGGDR